MKVKTKLIASIMSICLVAAVFAIGVFALRTANLKIGGDVSFNATGVEAHIKNASLTGLTSNTQTIAANTAEGEVINTSMTQAEIDNTFATWQNLTLDFNANADDIVFKFDIANTSANADNYIEIDYDYSFSTTDPNVDVFPGETTSGNWANNNYILAPKAAEANATYETFTLKFRVVDKELNVQQGTKVNLTISLKHVTPKSAAATSGVVTIDNVKYRLNYPFEGLATITGHTLSESATAVVIHPVVKDTATNAVPCVVREIASEAFSISGVTELTIPNSVTTIANEAFFVNSITELVIPKSVTTIGDAAFNGCRSLTTLSLPNSLTVIKSGSFSNLQSLASIAIPNSVTTIEFSAFSGSSGLKSITIPSSVTSIGNATFSGCSGLISINVASGNSAYDSRNNCNAIIETQTNVLLAGCKNTIIPKDVSVIDSRAFYECSGLTTITIPSSVQVIRQNAFSECAALTSVEFEFTSTDPTWAWFAGDSIEQTSGLSMVIFNNQDTAGNATLLKTVYADNYIFLADGTIV